MRRYSIQRSITRYVYIVTLYSAEADKVIEKSLSTYNPLTFKELTKQYADTSYKPVKLVLDRTETELRGMNKDEFYKYSHPYDEAEKPVIINLKKEIK